MLTHKPQLLARAALLTLALLTGVILANAQVVPVPDCCQQAIAWKASCEATRTLLDSTRAVGQRVIQATDERLATALKTTNGEIASLNASNQKLLREQEGLHASLDETNSRLLTTEAELRHWKPRTKAGIFLRKIRNGLAVVGGVAIVAGGLLIAL